MIYGKMDDFLKMVKTLREYSRRYSTVPGLQRNAVEAPYRIAEAARKRRDWVTATRYYQQAISQFRNLGLAPASEAAEFGAQASFRLAERRLESFLKTSVKGPISKLVKREQKSAQAALNLKREYDAIFSYKRARWTLAAMCRGGTIYEHFAKTLAAGYREAPIPRKVKRLGQDAIDMYQEQLDQLLEQRVSPVEKQAKKFFEMCVKQAKNFGVSNEYTEDGMRRLNAMDPTTYPLRKRAIVEESLE
jgi:tetratricopeptide (TPR) repeat protein